MKHTLIAVSAAIALACLAGCARTREAIKADVAEAVDGLNPAPAPEPVPPLGVKTYKTPEK